MIFTLILSLFFLIIYFSGRENRANKWCAIGGVFFCIGVFKEYYFFDLVPKLPYYFGNAISHEQYTVIYSIMTAMLYYISMPAAVIACFYLTNFDTRKRRAFIWHRNCIFIPPVIISLFYSPTQICYYQLTDKVFWYVVSIFNVGYGIVFTVFMVLNVLNDKNNATRRPKKLINIALLPGLWYWLITIFIIHSLGIKSLFKVWKGNSVIISVLVIYYVIMAFKEGIMGLRLKKEHYYWKTDMQMINKSASYTRHLIKNETTKIEWCVNRLKNDYGDNAPDEIEIIIRSISHLKDFIEKTQQYSGEITLDKKIYNIEDVIKESIYMMKGYIGDSIEILMSIPDNIMLLCDRTHVVEVLNNLISNSAEAMNKTGTISVDAGFDKRRQYFNISVSDTGTGIDKKDIPFIFEPFYTTKRSNSNFGLGLSYCSNVMQVHKGYIDIKSSQGSGTSAVLHFPAKYVIEGEYVEENKGVFCGR